jgi:hypothetical protein
MNKKNIKELAEEGCSKQKVIYSVWVRFLILAGVVFLSKNSLIISKRGYSDFKPKNLLIERSDSVDPLTFQLMQCFSWSIKYVLFNAK